MKATDDDELADETAYRSPLASLYFFLSKLDEVSCLEKTYSQGSLRNQPKHI